MAAYNIPSWALAAFRHLGEPLTIELVTMGLINKTYVVTSSARKYVLQEMSPIFDTSVTEDSLAVSIHLERAGIKVPKPYLTSQETLFASNEQRVFRALKFIDGNSGHTITSLGMAKTAGTVVGRFHLAMLDFQYDYRSQRRHGGEYDYHRANLLAALDQHHSHDFFAQVKPFAIEMTTAIETLTEGLITTPRHVHGDPKVSNILFNDDKEAICLVDFDTLSKAGWSLEMGDALRSWCNPYPEDVLDAHVDLARAEAALLGYGDVMRGVFSRQETDELVKHTQAISLCLAMRYLADVLNESYFRYDSARFSRAAEHQWLKAQAMYQLFLDFGRKKTQISTMVKDLLLTSPIDT